jgi:hypothetical protein
LICYRHISNRRWNHRLWNNWMLVGIADKHHLVRHNLLKIASFIILRKLCIRIISTWNLLKRLLRCFILLKENLTLSSISHLLRQKHWILEEYLSIRMLIRIKWSIIWLITLICKLWNMN